MISHAHELMLIKKFLHENDLFEQINCFCIMLIGNMFDSSVNLLIKLNLFFITQPVSLILKDISIVFTVSSG